MPGRFGCQVTFYDVLTVCALEILRCSDGRQLTSDSYETLREKPVRIVATTMRQNGQLGMSHYLWDASLIIFDMESQ